MEKQPTPGYAIFDDYRATQNILVWVRWAFIVFGLYVTNVRPTFELSHLIRNDVILGGEALLNVYLHWHVLKAKRLSLPTVIFASIVDAAVMSVIIMFSETPAFSNQYYFVYFLFSLCYALVLPLSLALIYGICVASSYAILSLILDPGVNLALTEEKVLIGRTLVILAAAVLGSLVVRIERALRQQAVEAERERARENLALQRRAQEAELKAQAERSRIGREIHDGIAQSIYMLSLNLETSADLVSQESPELRSRLEKLVKLAKQTLLETRHYIFDLKPMLSGDISLARMLENQVKEFKVVTSIPIELKVTGAERPVPVATSAALYRIAQEALANVYKHAQASHVEVELSFDTSAVQLRIGDNGRGFSERNGGSSGYGLQNMQQRVQELGGNIAIESNPGQGTTVQIELPLREA